MGNAEQETMLLTAIIPIRGDCIRVLSSALSVTHTSCSVFDTRLVRCVRLGELLKDGDFPLLLVLPPGTVSTCVISHILDTARSAGARPHRWRPGAGAALERSQAQEECDSS